jgi:hypothetical protein
MAGAVEADELSVVMFVIRKGEGVAVARKLMTRH